MRNSIKVLVVYWLVGWAILVMGRVALVVFQLNISDVTAQSSFIPLAVFNAIRFDFQVLAYISILPTLALILHSFLWGGGWIKAFCRWYYAVVYTLVTIVTVVDLGFYNNFGEHFNVTTFDFFNEGAVELTRVIWEEHPVPLYLCLCVVVFILVFKLPVAGWLRDSRVRSLKTASVVWFAWLLLMAVFLRGSLTEFPLQAEDLYVSPNKPLNDCVPNALYALKKAMKEKATAFRKLTEEELLAEYGFESEDEAWQCFSPGRTSPFVCMQDSMVRVPENAGKPNIVIMLSESWSGWLCDYALKEYTAKLLCGMQKHLTEDLFYNNFVSVENGTIATIERLAISTPYPRIANSKYRFRHFASSIADPFNASGYATAFMSGIDQGWQNVGETLKNQGFDRIVSKYELLAEHPDYEYNSIGIFDHYLMKALMEDLNKTDDRPKMYFVVTTTNHPPFVYPKDIPLPEMGQAFYDNPCFANSREVQEKYIKGFQYANLSMARFLDALKASPAGENTIVVITGDHNVRTALEYSDDGLHVPTEWRTRVPLYIYLPAKYRDSADGRYAHNTKVWGCHYDILPTIAPFAFDAGVKYFSFGQNLFSDTLDVSNSYGSNVNGVSCAQEYEGTARRKAAACDLLLQLYFSKTLF